MRKPLSKKEQREVCEFVKNELANGKILKDILSEITETKGISSSEVYSWNKKFGMIFENNSFSDEERLCALEMVVEKMLFGILLSVAVNDVAKKFDIDKRTIYKWNREFKIFETSKKFSIDEKKVICEEIKDMIIAGAPTSYAVSVYAEDLGVTVKSIYNWNQNFHIFEVRDYSKRKSSFPSEFIKMVVNEAIIVGKGEEKINAIAKKYNISPTTVYKWRRDFQR